MQLNGGKLGAVQQHELHNAASDATLVLQAVAGFILWTLAGLCLLLTGSGVPRELHKSSCSKVPSFTVVENYKPVR